jgi:hypothetical protein
MIERQDVIDYTASKQELQVIVETLFDEMMTEFNLTAFLADPRGYTRAFLALAAVNAIRAVAPEAYRLGQDLASKAATT